MLIGYARISKADGSQSLDLQRDALREAGVSDDAIYEDQASGQREDRPGLAAFLKAARQGDVIVVWRLDRLGRNLRHLVNLVQMPVLKNLSFRVDPGEKVAIVGATGAGKTTLISLLSRFYDVNRGHIAVDGVDLRLWDPAQLRQRIAVVLQDVFLFSGSVADNIRLWDGRVSDQAMKEAAHRVLATDFIESMPNGYATILNERGQSISSGQRQLLSFARALARNPEILVLDEATSSVDPHTEHQIQIALAKLIEDRTALIIAHRLSTIQNCNRILVLHKGELVEEGSHAQLLARQGIYFKLYQLQFQDQLYGRWSAARKESPGA